MEKWVWINGCKGKYEVSTHGRIRSHIGKTKLLKGSLSNKGYPRVNVRGKYELVHRIVAEHFLPNPDNLPDVDHLDNDRTNPRLDNLEWVTRSTNIKRRHDRHWKRISGE